MRKLYDLLLDSGFYTGLVGSTYLEINLVGLLLLKLQFHVWTDLIFVLLEKVFQGGIIVVDSGIHRIESV